MVTARKKSGGAVSTSKPGPPPTGNKFEFWIPKGANKPVPPPPSPKPSTAPLVSVPSASSAAIVPKSSGPTPSAFIKGAFKHTGASPFGVNGSFGTGGDGHQAISKLLLVRAGLELGYGPRNTWTTAFVLSKSSGRELASHLLLRLQSIMTCLEWSPSQALTLRPFYQQIEASEKVSVSFVLGSMFSYLAARMWLEAAGEKLELFLHAGLYTKAIGTSGAAVHFTSTSNQRPDFVVLSKQGNWSLFESKGGTSTNRWAQLYKGLSQLQGSPHVGWSSALPVQPPQALVCVHTDVDAKKPLTVTAIDPPADDFPSIPGPEEPIPKAPDLVLVNGVVQLMVFMQSIEQFRAMDADMFNQGSQGDKIAVETRRFEGLLIGIPRKFLELETRLRATLACYLTVRELAVERNLQMISNLEDLNLSVRVSNWINKHAEASGEVKVEAAHIAERLHKVQNGFNRALLFDDSILDDCAVYLGVKVLADELAAEVSGMSVIERLLGTEGVVTTGGLWVGVIPSPPQRDMVS